VKKKITSTSISKEFQENNKQQNELFSPPIKAKDAEDGNIDIHSPKQINFQYQQDALDLDILQKQTTMKNSSTILTKTTSLQQQIHNKHPEIDLTQPTRIDLTRTNFPTTKLKTNKHDEVLSDSSFLQNSELKNDSLLQQQQQQQTIQIQQQVQTKSNLKRKRTSSSGMTRKTTNNKQAFNVEDEDKLEQDIIIKKHKNAPTFSLSSLRATEEKQKNNITNKPDFAYVSVVKKQSERQKLPTHECEECQKVWSLILFVLVSFVSKNLFVFFSFFFLFICLC
jgi:hypothetical protein